MRIPMCAYRTDPLGLARLLVFAGVGALAVHMTPVHAAATISITDNLSNCADFQLGGTVGARTLTCVAITSPPPGAAGAPSGCTLVARLNGVPVDSVAAGSALTLVATCSGGGAPTSYAWTGVSGVTSTSANSIATNISVSTPYSVTPSNASGSGNTAQKTVNVATSAPPPSAGAISCTSRGFDRTLNYTWNWAGVGGNIAIDTASDANGLGTNGIVVIAFRVPANGRTLVTGGVSTAEYPGNAMRILRTISVSTTPCDFNGEFPWTVTDQNPGLSFSVGSYIPSVWPPLEPGRQYYINIANRNGAGINQCTPDGAGYPVCDIRIGLTKPQDY
jgi:hypothetical protein